MVVKLKCFMFWSIEFNNKGIVYLDPQSTNNTVAVNSNLKPFLVLSNLTLVDTNDSKYFSIMSPTN